MQRIHNTSQNGTPCTLRPEEKGQDQAATLAKIERLHKILKVSTIRSYFYCHLVKRPYQNKTDTMSDTKTPRQTYKASCHCGTFAYDVTTAPLYHEDTEVVHCNCSICTRNGYLLIYVPDDQVTFHKGQFEDLKVTSINLCHSSIVANEHSRTPLQHIPSRTTSAPLAAAPAWRAVSDLVSLMA